MTIVSFIVNKKQFFDDCRTFKKSHYTKNIKIQEGKMLVGYLDDYIFIYCYYDFLKIDLKILNFVCWTIG